MNSLRERGSQPRAKQSRLRERFRAETRDAVLTAAELVFAEAGLRSASMGEIAKRAGVAVGTLYNHFADREALLQALLGMRRKELLEQLDVACKAVARGSAIDQLVALVTALFAHVDSHRGLFILLLAEERIGHSSEMARELYQRVDKIMRRGVRDGILLGDGADSWAPLLLGCVRGVWMRELYGAPSGPLSLEVGRVIDFFLHGASRP